MEVLSNATGENTLPELNGDAECFRFTIKNIEKKLLLLATSAADRILWIRKLEEARKHCLLTERAALQRQRSSKLIRLITPKSHWFTFSESVLAKIGIAVELFDRWRI